MHTFRLLLSAFFSLILFGLPVISVANTIKGVTVSREDEGLLVNTPIEISLTFGVPPEQVNCGLAINWGDGEIQKLRIGTDQQIKPPFKIQHTYKAPGQYKPSISGETLIRGLRSVSGCEGQFAGTLNIVDAVGQTASKDTGRTGEDSSVSSTGKQPVDVGSPTKPLEIPSTGIAGGTQQAQNVQGSQTSSQSNREFNECVRLSSSKQYSAAWSTCYPLDVQGNLGATYVLSVLLWNGQGVEQNQQQALEKLRRVANGDESGPHREFILKAREQLPNLEASARKAEQRQAAAEQQAKRQSEEAEARRQAVLAKEEAERKQKERQAERIDKSASADMVAAAKFIFGDSARVLNAKQCIIEREQGNGYEQIILTKLDRTKAKVESRLSNAGGRNFYTYMLVVPGQKGAIRNLDKTFSEKSTGSDLEEAIGLSFLEDDRKRKLDAFLYFYKQGCSSAKLAF